MEVPPVSDPVCIYCGTNRSDGPRQEPHQKGYPCCVETGGGSSHASDYVINNHHTVTYNEPETVYIPPTPIRETPEGQMMMAVCMPKDTAFPWHLISLPRYSLKQEL